MIYLFKMVIFYIAMLVYQRETGIINKYNAWSGSMGSNEQSISPIRTKIIGFFFIIIYLDYVYIYYIYISLYICWMGVLANWPADAEGRAISTLRTSSLWSKRWSFVSFSLGKARDSMALHGTSCENRGNWIQLDLQLAQAIQEPLPEVIVRSDERHRASATR